MIMYYDDDGGVWSTIIMIMHYDDDDADDDVCDLSWSCIMMMIVVCDQQSRSVLRMKRLARWKGSLSSTAATSS